MDSEDNLFEKEPKKLIKYFKIVNICRYVNGNNLRVKKKSFLSYLYSTFTTRSSHFNYSKPTETSLQVNKHLVVVFLYIEKQVLIEERFDFSYKCTHVQCIGSKEKEHTAHIFLPLSRRMTLNEQNSKLKKILKKC